MADNLINAAQGYIESRLSQTKRKFEIVYSSSKDQNKRQQILDTLKDIERDLKKLRAGYFTVQDLGRYKITVEELQANRTDDLARPRDISEYTILRNVPIHPINKYSKNREVNAIYSYLKFFESEYLGLLSEQNLRLDYGHAFQRDQFYLTHHELIRFVLQYGDVLEQIENASSKEYKERLISIQGKHYRDMILRTGKFLHSLEKFIADLEHSEAQGEKVMTEPEKIVEISGDNSNLNGITARQALNDLKKFVAEFVEFLKIPEIKKIEDEE